METYKHSNMRNKTQKDINKNKLIHKEQILIEKPDLPWYCVSLSLLVPLSSILQWRWSTSLEGYCCAYCSRDGKLPAGWRKSLNWKQNCTTCFWDYFGIDLGCIQNHWKLFGMDIVGLIVLEMEGCPCEERVSIELSSCLRIEK